MSLFVFLLITFSAVLHASWNLLAKRSSMSVSFYAAICMTAASMWLHTQLWTPVRVWHLHARGRWGGVTRREDSPGWA